MGTGNRRPGSADATGKGRYRRSRIDCFALYPAPCHPRPGGVPTRRAVAQPPMARIYIDDGMVEIDNNAAERALRAVALGRQNFLFAGSDSGGERAAAIYSLSESAKLNGLDPEAYLRHVLTHIADHPVNKVDDFLPWNVAAAIATPGATDA